MRELWVIDAVRRETRTFRPTTDGYLVSDIAAASELVAPRVAPDVFALRLDALDLA